MCPMCPIWAHFRAQSWAQLVTIFSKYHRVWWYVICTTSTTKTINSTKCGVVRFWEKSLNISKYMKSEVQWKIYLMYLIEVHFEVHSEVHPIVWPTWSPTVSKMRYHLESILNFKFKNFFHLFSFSISNFLSMLISTFTS